MKAKNMDALLQVGVKAFLKNKKGKYLFLQRSDVYAKAPGEWDIPGGRINPRTPLLENLKREIKEETGLTLNKVPRLIAAQDIFAGDKHVVRLSYIGVIEGVLTLSEEHKGFAWFSIEELGGLTPLDKYIKELIDNGLLRS